MSEKIKSFIKKIWKYARWIMAAFFALISLAAIFNKSWIFAGTSILIMLMCTPLVDIVFRKFKITGKKTLGAFAAAIFVWLSSLSSVDTTSVQNNQLQEKVAEIESLQQQLQEKGIEISNKNEQIAQKNSQIEEKDKTIKELESKVSKLEKQIEKEVEPTPSLAPKPTATTIPTPVPTPTPTPEPMPVSTPAPTPVPEPVTETVQAAAITGTSNNTSNSSPADTNGPVDGQLPLKAICKDGTTSYQDDASKPDYRGMCSGHNGIQTRLGRVP